METWSKIFIMVYITISIGQAKEDFEILKEMMVEMKMEMRVELNERLVVSEAKLLKTEKELASTKDDLAEALTELATIKHDLETAKNKVTAMHSDYVDTKADMMSKTNELKREVANLRDS